MNYLKETIKYLEDAKEKVRELEEKRDYGLKDDEYSRGYKEGLKQGREEGKAIGFDEAIEELERVKADYQHDELKDLTT